MGYTFLGWYEGEKLLGTELSYTFSMPAKDVTYTAKWVENEEMAPFDFTSTPTTCVVTGVKDKTARSFVVPVYVTEIGEGAFSGCGSLESFALPFVGGNAGAVSASRSTLFGYIFGSASYEGGRQTSQVFSVNDTDVYTCYVSDSLRSVKITGGEILYGAFSGCTLLTEAIVPETIKTVADYAFYYCSNLKQFTIPVTVESIGDHAFYYCYGLKSITIPDRGNKNWKLRLLLFQRIGARNARKGNNRHRRECVFGLYAIDDYQYSRTRNEYRRLCVLCLRQADKRLL